MSATKPIVSSGQPNPSLKIRYDLFGAVGGIAATLLLFIGILVQYLSLWKGGTSGTTEVKSQLTNAMAYVIPTLITALVGWWFYAAYSSSINKAGILWTMGILAIIFSNIALVASLFQVKVISQY